jgi:hypothetical protein
LALTQSCVTVPHLPQHVARQLLRLHQGCVTRVSVEQGGLKSHLFTRLFSQNPRLPHVPNDGRPGVSIATARSPSLSITWFLPHHHTLFRLRLRGRRLLPLIRPSVSGPLLPGLLDDYLSRPSKLVSSTSTDSLLTHPPTNQPLIHFSISLRCHNDHFFDFFRTATSDPFIDDLRETFPFVFEYPRNTHTP